MTPAPAPGRPGRPRIVLAWLGVAATVLAAVLLDGYLSRRWEAWSPGSFSLELCVVQEYGSLTPTDGGPAGREPEAVAAERARREGLCTERLRSEHRSARQGPVRAALVLALLVHVGAVGAATRRWRSPHPEAGGKACRPPG